MAYKFDIQASGNYSKGRPGPPRFIVIHHWGIDRQRHDNVARYLCRAGGNSSAHYVASAGRVTQLVDPDNRAWHAGRGGNPYGIGIECRPECTPDDFNTVAELIAELRRRYGPLPLHGHKDYMATACPGRWYPRLAELSALADQKTKGTKPAPAPAKPATPAKPAAPARPDLEALATEVIRGRYGNGAERKRRLGPNYAAVQAIVNRRLRGR